MNEDNIDWEGLDELARLREGDGDHLETLIRTFGISYKYFVSNSKGRGKRRRRSTEVEFVRIPYGKKKMVCISLTNGILSKGKNGRKPRFDSLAQEVFPEEAIPPHKHATDILLEKLREINLKKSR